MMMVEPWQWQSHEIYTPIVAFCLTLWFLFLSITMIQRIFFRIEREHPKQIETSKFIRNFSAFTILLFLWSSTLGVIVGLSYAEIYRFDDIFCLVMYILFVVPLIFALICVVLCSIFRLSTSFKGSMFQVSNITLYTYYVLLSVFFIVGLIVAVFFLLEVYNFVIIVFSSVLILGMCMIFHVCYTFNRNLFLLIASRKQTAFDEFGQKSKSVASDLSERQLIMIELITKYTLIHSVGVLAFLFAIISSGWVSVIGVLFGGIYVELGRIIFLWTMAVAIIISTYSVLLSFKTMDAWYYASYGKCHSLLNKCCIALATRKVNDSALSPRRARSESDSEL